MDTTNTPVDVSICIPTYNRAPQLAQCLDHLLTFRKLNFEIIIGNNASTDNTQDVIDSYSTRFPRFKQLRHKENIGMIGNVNSTMRLATGNYVYGLSDDDLVFESALLFMFKMLAENPSIIAINGAYIPTLKLEIGMDMSFAHPEVLVFNQGDFAALANNLMTYDGPYMLRRETVQRHWFLSDRSVGTLPITAKLLMLGNVVYSKTPVLQHFHSSDSQSTKLAEPWFQDGAIGDIETSFAIAAEFFPSGAIDKLRHNWCLSVYLQAARMAVSQRKFSDCFHFLKRLKCIAGVEDTCLVKSEQNFLFEVALEQLIRIFTENEIDSAAIEDTPLMHEVQRRLSLVLPDIAWSRFNLGEKRSQAKIHLLTRYTPDYMDDRNIGIAVSFIDVASLQRLTFHPLNFNVDPITSEVSIIFTTPEGQTLSAQHSSQYSILTNRYAPEN